MSWRFVTSQKKNTGYNNGTGSEKLFAAEVLGMSSLQRIWIVWTQKWLNLNL